jgi:hypothetical protein
MAGRLKEKTNIDPFTIDQITYSEKGDTKYISPYHNNKFGKTINYDK